MVPAPSTPTESISAIGSSLQQILLLALRPFFQEGGHALALFRGIKQERLAQSLDAVRVAAARRGIERGLGDLQRERGIGRDGMRQLPGGLHGVARLAEALENAERVGLLGLQNSPCENQVLRPADADEPR